MPGVVTAKAFAKLNLSLAVGPPEPSISAKPGYHPIVSWFSAIDLADDLTIRALAATAQSRFDIRFADDAPGPNAGMTGDWPVEKDLAFRAHAAVEHEVGRALPIELTLSKRIPAGGGLGGGSSDAATTYRALNHLFDLGITAPRLAELGAALGSDIPYFLDELTSLTAPPRPAIVSGFGEAVDRLPPRACGAVLVMPPFRVATADVYRAFDKRPNLFNDGSAVRNLAAQQVPIWRTHTMPMNSLAVPASDIEPRLHQITAHVLRETGIDLHLSGSGGTLFHLCDPTTAADAAKRLRTACALFPGVSILPTRLV